MKIEMFVNNAVRFFPSNCEVCFIIGQALLSYGLYAHKIFTFIVFSRTKGTKSFSCACQVRRYEREPAPTGDEPFLFRKLRKRWKYILMEVRP